MLGLSILTNNMTDDRRTADNIVLPIVGLDIGAISSSNSTVQRFWA